jgi:hypothetical protein
VGDFVHYFRLMHIFLCLTLRLRNVRFVLHENNKCIAPTLSPPLTQ